MGIYAYACWYSCQEYYIGAEALWLVFLSVLSPPDFLLAVRIACIQHGFLSSFLISHWSTWHLFCSCLVHSHSQVPIVSHSPSQTRTSFHFCKSISIKLHALQPTTALWLLVFSSFYMTRPFLITCENNASLSYMIWKT